MAASNEHVFDRRRWLSKAMLLRPGMPVLLTTNHACRPATPKRANTNLDFARDTLRFTPDETQASVMAAFSRRIR